jgi:hypothetical protein
VVWGGEYLMGLKNKANIKQYILDVLEVANSVVEESPHIEVQGMKDTRISIFAVAKLIMEADEKE